MTTAQTTTRDLQLLSNLDQEEQALLNDCMTNMIGHLERNISRPAKSHKQVSKLLTYRYLFQKNLRAIEN